MDPLQWMGAVRMRVQTADKNITIIHTTSPSVNDLRRQKLRVCKKQNKHNIAFSSEEFISTELGEKSAQIRHSLQAKTALNKYVWILMWKTTGD